jgi:hypothetical protein
LLSALLLSDEFGEPLIRGLRLARQACEVDADNAEAPAVALRPFEIVEQRPDEIAAQIDAGGNGALRRSEVVVDIGGALGIVNRAVAGNNVFVTSAILGDVDFRLVVARADAN